ncbi:MAG: MBL fold metallo-hydrolase [Polyangiaceae bacterium]
MAIFSFPVGPLGCNCSIVADLDARQAICIDPGGDFPAIEALLNEHQLKVTAIVHTHTHIDHVGATCPLQKSSGAEAHIHEADRFLYDMLPVQASMLGIKMPEKADLVGTLVDDFNLRAGKYELGVLHTPGHTPGSVSFLLKHDDEQVLFSGDTLFQGSIGRTDLWGGDFETIQRSLKQKLMTLDVATRVVPGHGPDTQIGLEQRINPFLQDL